MRREFPRKVREAAHKRSGGVCECHRLLRVPGLVPGGCGAPLVAGQTYYEHIIADGAGGEPTLDNCAVLTRTCWKIKTAKYDLPIVAKTKRQRAGHIGSRTRSARPMPGSKASGWRKPFNGRAERRT